jgi:hypothetical protein
LPARGKVTASAKPTATAAAQNVDADLRRALLLARHHAVTGEHRRHARDLGARCGGVLRRHRRRQCRDGGQGNGGNTEKVEHAIIVPEWRQGGLCKHGALAIGSGPPSLFEFAGRGKSAEGALQPS